MRLMLAEPQLDFEGTWEIRPRWLAASGRAFFEGMCAVRVAGTLRDVTEQKSGLQ